MLHRDTYVIVRTFKEIWYVFMSSLLPGVRKLDKKGLMGLFISS